GKEIHHHGTRPRHAQGEHHRERSMNSRDNVAGGASSSAARNPATASNTPSGPLSAGASKTGRTALTSPNARTGVNLESTSAVRISAIQRHTGVAKISKVTKV